MKHLIAALLVLSSFTLLASSARADIDLSKPLPEVSLKSGKKLSNVTIISYASNVLTAKWEGGRGTISYQDLPDDIRTEIYARRAPPETPIAPNQKKWTADDERQRVIESAPQLVGPKIEMHYEKSLLAKKIAGQIFITTKGGQNIKLGGVKICVYPVEVFDEFRQWQHGPGLKRAEYFTAVADKFQQGHNPSAAITYYEFSLAANQDTWTYLPTALFTTVTDADGRYQLEHQINGDFIVFARAKREVVNATENYIWSVKSSEIPFSGELLLHNANMN